MKYSLLLRDSGTLVEVELKEFAIGDLVSINGKTYELMPGPAAAYFEKMQQGHANLCASAKLVASNPIEAREFTRRRIIKRLRNMRKDLRETIDLKESWNDNRPEEMPFDVGYDKTVLHYVEKSLRAWRTDDIAAANYWNDKMQELAEAHDDEV